MWDLLDGWHSLLKLIMSLWKSQQQNNSKIEKRTLTALYTVKMHPDDFSKKKKDKGYEYL